MKKFLFIAFVICAMTSTAQNSFVIYKQNTTTSVSPNSLFDVATTAATITNNTFDVENISASTHTYNIKRYDLHLWRVNAVDTTAAQFCFASQCYGPDVTLGLFPLTLTTSANTATLGAYYSLDCDLAESTRIGYSLVKYTLFNVNQPSDSLQFTMRYNVNLINVGIKEQNLSSQELQISPNPAKDMAKLTFVSANAVAAQVTIYNAIGQKVFTQVVNTNIGSNTVPVNVSELPAGVYHVSIDADHSVITKKLIVTK